MLLWFYMYELSNYEQLLMNIAAKATMFLG